VRDRKGSAAEKLLILKSLYELSGYQVTPLLTVPVNESPVVAGTPALTQFKRIILQLTIDDRPTFLDPTNAAMPYGYLPWYLYRAYALPLGKDDNAMFKIPPRKEKNTMECKLDCQITAEGNLKGKGTISLNDQYHLVYYRSLLRADSTERRKLLTTLFLSGMEPGEIRSAAVYRDTTRPAGSIVEVEFEKHAYAEPIGDQILLMANCAHRAASDFLPQDEQRTTPVHFNYPSTTIYHVIYTLPADFAFGGKAETFDETLANNLDYSASITPGSDGHSMVYHRVAARTGQFFDAGAYRSLREYFQKVAQHDATEVPLKMASTMDDPK
jgi:hypothetical protein